METVVEITTPSTGSQFAYTKRISVCDTQPLTGEGIRTLLSSSPDMALADVTNSLDQALHSASQTAPDVLVLDKALGLAVLLEWLEGHKSNGLKTTAVVIWGISFTGSEALRLFQAGADGILRKTASIASIISCFRSVAVGQRWMEEHLFSNGENPSRSTRRELTLRERQVLILVQQGLRNGDIAAELGIRATTVKIHLKHIFTKTGIHGRYGLALEAFRDATLGGTQVAAN